MEHRIRILVIDDHPLVREGIAAIIRTQPDMELVAQAGSGREGIEQYQLHKPDLVLMDARLPDIDGIDTMIAIRSEFVNARVLMLSTFQADVEIQRALNAGARGFLLKTMPPPQLLRAVRQVHEGKKCVPPEVASQLAELDGDSLTAREVEILRTLAEGHRNRDVADRLGISENTVKVHVKNIMEKLGANDRTEAVVVGVRRGIITL
jgi:DNA-binding NarL/FixJ family response regulator